MFKFFWNLPVNIYITVWFYYFHLRSLFLVSSNLFFIWKEKWMFYLGRGGDERCMSWKPCKNLTVRFGKFLPISARSRNTIYARIIRAEFLSSHRAMIWICKKSVYTCISFLLHSRVAQYFAKKWGWAQKYVFQFCCVFLWPLWFPSGNLFKQSETFFFHAIWFEKIEWISYVDFKIFFSDTLFLKNWI